MSIRLEGIEELLGKFDKMANAEGLKEALEQATLLVEGEAKKKAPKKDGDLRRSIQSRVEGFEGIVSTPLEYAPYVEYGTGLFSSHPMGGRKDVPWVYQDEKTGQFVATSGQHPQPYMAPALNENREEIIRILKGGLIDD